jgi:MFS family permease
MSTAANEMAGHGMPVSGEVETNIPARMDRLPWARWHWLIILSLGITWVLDGLEVTIVGAIAPTLTKHATLSLSASQAGFQATAYLIGAVVGALFFSYLTDRMGRKKLFMITLVVYLVATICTAFSWSFWTFAIFRFFTGTGIGGEYAAINSAIDELIPARVRGHVDLGINGSWWIGTAMAAAASLLLLDPHIFPVNVGWRIAFGMGAVLGLAVLLVRRYVPESPRWLMTHGRVKEAEAIVSDIERTVQNETHQPLPEPEGSIRVKQRDPVGFIKLAKILFSTYPTRCVLGLSLMCTQAFLYNAIFFTYGLVLTKFYKVPASSVGLYLLPFAVGNFFGPLLLGRLFDTVGRRTMIFLTYAVSGVLLAISGYLFMIGALNAVTQTIAWMIIFFFASAGASSAYLTVSEVFPLEIRAMAIAFFYAVGTGVGGAFAPWLFGKLIQTSARSVFYGDLLGASLMVVGGLVALVWGVAAEGKSLEAIAQPLSAVKAAGRLAPQVPKADATASA